MKHSKPGSKLQILTQLGNEVTVMKRSLWVNFKINTGIKPIEMSDLTWTFSAGEWF